MCERRNERFIDFLTVVGGPLLVGSIFVGYPVLLALCYGWDVEFLGSLE